MPAKTPGITWTAMLNILVAVLGPILRAVTPVLREQLEEWLIGFYKKAKTTDNPWDDFLAELLLRIFGIPLP